MADLDLVSLLLLGDSQKKAIAESDPYAQVGSIFGGLSNQVLAAPSSYSTKDKILSGLVTGGLQGLFGGLSQDYQGRANDAYQNVLLNLAGGKQVEKPSVLNPSIFGLAKNQANAFQILNSAKKIEAAQAAEQKLGDEVIKELLATDNPAQLNRKQEVLKQLFGAEKAPQPIATQPSKVTPGSVERLDQLIESAGGDEDVAGQLFVDEVKEAREYPRKLEKDTYDRITGLPSYKSFQDISANFETLAALADNTEAATSPAMITAFGRILDPGATVREGEYSTINQNTQSLLDKIQGDWRQAFKGETSLSPKARQALVNIAAEKYNAFGSTYGLERQKLLEALTQQGGSVANIPTQEFSAYKPIGLTPQQIVASMKKQGLSKSRAKFLFESMFGNK